MLCFLFYVSTSDPHGVLNDMGLYVIVPIHQPRTKRDRIGGHRVNCEQINEELIINVQIQFYLVVQVAEVVQR